jgi:uncharacterized membrane protein YheB (UPF0754 family)
MNNILPFLAPPILGAFIGYFTNYVAIRMLFRPLKPWRFLGLTVPMTPGVIPKKRDQLAENIGKMVGGHLLTSADVHQALTEQGFRHELQDLLESRLDGLMEREFGPVATLVPQRFRGYFEMGIKILKWRLSRHLHDYLDNDAIADRVSQVVDERLDVFLAEELGCHLPVQARDRLSGVLEGTIGQLFASSWFAEKVRESLKNRFEAVVTENRTLADLLPASFLQLLLDRLEKEAPQLLAKIARSLEEPAMQDRIAGAIGKTLQKFIGSLGPLAAMMGGFLNPELIDRKVRSYLAEHRDDLSRWQSDEKLQRQITGLLQDKLKQLFATPVATLLARVSPEKQAAVRKEISEQLIAILQRPETAGFCSALLRQGLEQQADRPLHAVLASLAGEEGLVRGRKWAAEEIIALLRSTESKKILDGMISEILLRYIQEKPIGSLTTFLPKEIREGISNFLLEQVSDLLVREVPGLVDSLNIQKMVACKVRSLDLLSLEGLLLSIMEEQFKYINIFGAILGFLIGSLNLLLILAI